MHKFNLIELILHSLLAFFGGIVNELVSIKNGKTIQMIQILCGCIISSFVGVIIYFLCKQYEISDYLTAFFTSLAGYSGYATLNFLTQLLKKALNGRVKVNIRVEDKTSGFEYIDNNNNKLVM